jgi:quercetin dioxygenase-like cupin family protein
VEHWHLIDRPLEPLHPEVLRSDDGIGRAVALHLPGGERLQEHETHEHTWVVVAQGELEIAQDGETISAGPGFVARFDPQERREVRALSDARLLLIFVPWPGVGHPSRAA